MSDANDSDMEYSDNDCEYDDYYNSGKFLNFFNNFFLPAKDENTDTYRNTVNLLIKDLKFLFFWIKSESLSWNNEITFFIFPTKS